MLGWQEPTSRPEQPKILAKRHWGKPSILAGFPPVALPDLAPTNSQLRPVAFPSAGPTSDRLGAFAVPYPLEHLAEVLGHFLREPGDVTLNIGQDI